ncbi:conserved hypothetical protein [uncultured Eubacteriales bacterium]|uniref:HD domain-containing protein n=1 Tax=uncultured Eubacteriales bacterium TaxID=172733 RepID=A0A212KI60_9FIRM|nr:conserved hypothetical protein [uncultured Eubacteriales bacterium]
MDRHPLYHHDFPGFLLELAGTDVVLRLQGVGMNCGCEYTSFPLFRACRPVSRYEHSLGVGLIVWHFTGNRAQAAAGLLHDISTPVFAHVVDFLNGDHIRQESTEALTEDFIAESSQLQAVLGKYGLTTAHVADYHRYPLADNDAPRLSADRLEYTLCNLVSYGVCTQAEVGAFYEDLDAEEGELVFRTPQTAATFTRAALAMAQIYICDEDRFAMEYLAGLIRGALKERILTATDLYRTEPEVIAKLEAAPETAEAWRRFRTFSRVLRADTPQGEGWLRVEAKKRYIDPYIQGLGRVSAAFPEIGREMADFLKTDFDYWLRGE